MDADFVDAMLVELRRVSHDLVAAGRAPTRPAAREFGHGASIGACLESARRLSELVPRLLDETPRTLDSRRPEIVETRTPRRAWPSRHPRDFVATAEGVVPARWLAEVTGETVSPAHLNRVVDALDAQAGKLLAAQARLLKFVGDAASSLAGNSEYAVADQGVLQDLLKKVEGTLVGLFRARQRIVRRLPSRRNPSSRSDPTWPSTPAWGVLKRILKGVDLSSDAASLLAAETLAHPVAMADVPFLYQRWVALQVLEAFGRRAWRTTGDPCGALWLGGCIELAHGRARVDMWIEPRLLPAKDAHRHPSGMTSKWHGIEQTPDIVLLFRTAADGEEAFVLDATLSSDEQVLSGKAKYLESIQLGVPRRVTGVLVPRAPLRAWAVAPTRDAHCRPFDSFGHTGLIPLRPGAGGAGTAGLDAWLDELAASV